MEIALGENPVPKLGALNGTASWYAAPPHSRQCALLKPRRH